MSEKWEYRVEYCSVGKYYDYMLELYLKPLGDEGWELVHITEWPINLADCASDVHLKAYFKRRKQPA